ncbi:7729_t:CDS:2, partial [Cetraspora pellucida]
FDTTTDGTAVIRLQQRLPNKQCAESRVIMRYILPNGSLVSNDVDFKFDPINFCPVDKIEIHPLARKFSLLLYLNSTTPGVSTGNVLVQYAIMIISQDGKIVQNNFPPLSTPFMSNVPAKTKMVLNNNGDFLWTFRPNNNDSIIYIKFTSQKLNTVITDPTTPPIYTMSASGIFQTPSNLNLQLQNYTTFPTFYGHFAIAFTARYNASSTTSQLFTYCTFLISETNNFIAPLMIYNPTTLLTSLEIMQCGESSFEGTAFKCLLSATQSNSISRIQVSFLLTGLITESISIPIDNITSSSIKTILIDPLYFGGYLQRIYLNSSEIVGKVFDIKGSLKGNWDLTFANLNFSNIVINGGSNGNEGGVGLFRNNTAILVLRDGGNGSKWSVVTTDIIKIYNPDNPLINPNIASTSLSMSTTIMPLDAAPLSITFSKPITLSTGNISIFQFISSTNGSLLRQTFSGNSRFCTLDSSNTVVTITMLQSTFNQPNEAYFIKIDDGFARSKATDMALVGVVDGFWIVSTHPVTALIKLSNNFLNISTTNHSQFLSQLISQLAQITPISLSRLSISSNFKFTSTDSTQDGLIIPIIIGTEKNGEIRSARVISDLDTLIKNRDISPMGMMNLTSGIDEGFGAQWSCECLLKFSMELF